MFRSMAIEIQREAETNAEKVKGAPYTLPVRVSTMCVRPAIGSDLEAY